MKCQLCLLMVLFSASSYSMEGTTTFVNKSADESRLNMEEFNTLFFVISYKNGSATIDHNETSSAPGFTPIANSSSIKSNSIEVGVMKEFWASSPLSFSLLANAGIDMGKDHGYLNNKSLTFTDKLKGQHYSAGGSLNLNFEVYGTKVQPFLFSAITKTDSKYLLEYSQGDNHINPTSIEYKNDIRQTDVGIGVRVIDPSVQMMSFLSLNYNVDTQNKTSTTSKNSSGEFVAGNTSQVKLRPLTLAVGFGFFF